MPPLPVPIRRVLRISALALLIPAGVLAVFQASDLEDPTATESGVSRSLSDPMARFQAAAGFSDLDFDPVHGYLRALLEALDIPVSSQTLVFSQSSFELKPRAG